MLIQTSHSLSETEAIGRCLGEALEPGTVVGLEGTLGTGKTRLTQGVALGLGIPAGQVVSPTFTICVPHHGRLTLWHLDAYRIEDPTEVDELGLDEAVEDGVVLIVEWSDRVVGLIPPPDLIGTLEADGDQQRRIRWAPSSDRGRSLVTALKQSLPSAEN